MKVTWASALLLGFVGGCGPSASGTSSDGAGPQAEQRLQKVMAEHAQLSTQLAGVPEEDRSECELSAGDCLLQVAERREKLVSDHGLNSCGHFPDAKSRGRCIADQLSGSGKSDQASEYYAFENWCLVKVAACTSVRADEARLVAQDARVEKRKQELELSPEGMVGWNAVESARAQVEYLRRTLPPKAADICEPKTDSECSARWQGELKVLREQLRADDYQAKAAATTYAAIKQTEASCQKPELDCLSAALSTYGVFPESRKWVDRNLALLAERQELASRVSAEAQAECLTDPQEAHQTRIAGTYSSYSRDPVLYFRTQLDKAFLALHQAQVTCLTSKEKPSQPSGEAVTATRTP